METPAWFVEAIALPAAVSDPTWRQIGIQGDKPLFPARVRIGTDNRISDRT